VKLDQVAGSGNDEFYTPAYAVSPILRYVPTGARVWCPFDTEESLFPQMLRAAGHDAVATHLTQGHDFFKLDPRGQGVTHVISNPPYSLKTEVLARLFELGLPFAMLVGCVGLFESRRRFEMFASNPFELMHFSKRIAYLKQAYDAAPSLNPPFSSVYVCSGMLPAANVFVEIAK
jgi:hypothetical protein